MSASAALTSRSSTGAAKTAVGKRPVTASVGGTDGNWDAKMDAASATSTLPQHGERLKVNLGNSDEYRRTPTKGKAPDQLPKHVLTVLTACEEEVTLILKLREPPPQFEALFITVLLLVSPSALPDTHFTWGAFRKWARSLDGAAGFLHNLRCFKTETVSHASAERTVKYMVEHALYPSNFEMGEKYHVRKICHRLAPSLCRWLWAICTSVMEGEQLGSHENHDLPA